MAAEKKLRKINSTVKVDPVIADLNLDNAEELLSDFDVIVDGTDNFSTRYLINDVAVKLGIPWVYGGAVSSRGMFAVIIPGKTPCYRCLFPEVPAGLGETCDTIGVLSPSPIQIWSSWISGTSLFCRWIYQREGIGSVQPACTISMISLTGPQAGR
jgi:molybdopterin/thiamine biosynthesis adenylyltransferase